MDNVKRLNFLVGEDFYFLTYSILHSLNAFTPAGGSFKDHRKLSHLVQIISDERVLGILSRYSDRDISNPVDRELLFSTFTRGELHKREVYKLLFSLSKKGFVTLSKTQKAEVLDVVLNRENIPESFLASPEFSDESEISSRLRKIVPRLATMTHETFMERVYSSRGLSVWVV